MSSRAFDRRIALATTVGICLSAQAFAPLRVGAETVGGEVPGGASAPQSSTNTPAAPAVPAPAVPDINSIITPNVSELLHQSGAAPSTTVLDFSHDAHLNFAGDFINSSNSTIYAISSNPNITSVTINANNIYNAGIITTILPSGGLPGYTNLVSNLSLVLNAVNNIVNIGEISSAGNLSMTAGNAIANISSASNINLSALMSAAASASLTANTIFNGGTISAATNLNLASMMANNLAINATGGVFQAGGAINIRDASFTAKQNLDVLGGVWSSPLFEFFSGTGVTKMALDSVGGVLNGSTGELYLSAVSTLNLGNIEILGDPVFSSEGDLILGNVSANEAISAFASGSILAGSLSAVGGGISLQAGSTITTSGALQTTHGIQMSAASVSAAGTSMHAGSNIFIAAAEININEADLNAGTSIDFVTTNVSASGSTLTAGSSIGSFGLTGGSANFNNAEINAGTNFEVGASSISANGVQIVAGGDIYMGSDTGSISAVSSKLTSHGFVTIDAPNGGLNFDQSEIRSNGGAIFLYGRNAVALGSVIDSSGATGGRIFIASQGGAVTGPADGLVTTGTNAALPPPGFFEVSISASNSVTLGHVSSGGGNISIQSGAIVERNGGAVLSIVAQEGEGSTKVASITSAGAFTGRGDIEVFGAGGGIELGSVTGNGTSVLIDSRAALSLEQVWNDISDDRGGTNSISIFAFDESPLVIEEGAISANGTSGGGIVQISNYGNGGLSVAAGGISAAATDSGGGGALFLTSSSWISVEGDLVVDGAQEGAGGILELTALGGNLDIGGRLSANGQGEGYSGGRIEMSALFGDITVSGASITANSEDGDGGGISVSAFGAISLPIAEAKGGGADGAGGSVSLSATSLDNVPLNLIASGSGSGRGGRVWLSADTSFDATESVEINATGGITGDGGNLSIAAGNNLKVNSANWNIAAGKNGNGGSVILTAGSNGASSELSVLGTVNVDGNGTGNGGYIEINALGSGSNLTIGKGEDANILSARSGIDAGDGGSIKVSSGGNLTVNGPSLRAYARGTDGSGGSINLTAGASDGGVIGAFALFALESENSSPAQLTVNGKLTTNGRGTGTGGSINLTALGSEGNILVNESSVISSTGSTGGIITASAGKDLSINSLVNASSTRNDGDGGTITIAAGTETGGTLFVNGDIRANGNGEGAGGSINLSSVADTEEESGLNSIVRFGEGADVQARGSRGGNIDISSSTFVETSGIFNVSSSGEGDGGTIKISAGSISINGELLANGSSTGSGGSIELISIDETAEVGILVDNNGSGSRIHAQGGDDAGNGGLIVLTSVAGIDAGSTRFSTSAIGIGDAGLIQLESKGGVSTGSPLLARAEVEGNGGHVFIKSGGGSLVSVGSAETLGKLAIDVSGAQNGGNAGTVTLISGSSVLVAGDIAANANSATGDAGKISITAGQGASGPLAGTVQVFGSLNANAKTAEDGNSGQAGKISVAFSFAGPLTIGKAGRGSPGGFIDNVYATAGDAKQGGTITFENRAATPLTITLQGGDILTRGMPTLSSSKMEDNMGGIELKQNFVDQAISMSGTGTVRGNFELKASTIKIHADGKNSVLGLSNLVATGQGSANSPSIDISASGTNSLVTFQSATADGSSFVSTAKDLLVRSDSILFNDDTKIVLGIGGEGNIESSKNNSKFNVEFNSANVKVSTTHENASQSNLPHSTFTIGSSDHKGPLTLGLAPGAFTAELELVDSELEITNHGNITVGNGLAIFVDGGARSTDMVSINTVSGDIQIDAPILLGKSTEAFAAPRIDELTKITIKSDRGDIRLNGSILGQNPSTNVIDDSQLRIHLETGSSGIIEQFTNSTIDFGEVEVPGILHVRTGKGAIGASARPISFGGSQVRLELDQGNAVTLNKDVFLSFNASEGSTLTIDSTKTSPTRTGNLFLRATTPCETCQASFELNSTSFNARSMEIANFGIVNVSGDVHITNGNIVINALSEISVGAENPVTVKADGPRGSGNVTLAVGALYQSLGNKPASVSTVEQGANIFWGNGVSTGSNVVVKALRANVIFSAQNASQIVIGDNVTIIADPPEDPVSMPLLIQTIPTVSNSLIAMPTLPAFTEPAADIATSKRFNLSPRLLTPPKKSNEIITSARSIALTADDEKLIVSSEPTDIATAFGNMQIPGDVAVMVKQRKGTVELLCLHNQHHQRIEIGSQRRVLETGEALLLSNESSTSFSVPVRKPEKTDNKYFFLTVAEFSLVSALSSSNNTLYAQLPQRLKQRVLKNAAALSIVTQSHGAFSLNK